MLMIFKDVGPRQVLVEVSTIAGSNRTYKTLGAFPSLKLTRLILASLDLVGPAVNIHNTFLLNQGTLLQ